MHMKCNKERSRNKIMSENSDNLISIIVPVYNTEKYLKQCLDSIRLQTNHNLDIILIDDGSTDSSAEICDRYEKMDSRIRVFHIKNGGVSNARNYGIQQAKGTWILFQDSDDWIEPDTCEQLLNTALEHNGDIIACEYFENYVNKELTYIDNNLAPLEIMTNKNNHIINLLFTDWSDKSRIECCMCIPWGKLIKAELIKKHQLTFPTNVNYYEDKYFNSILFLKAEKPLFLNKALIHHRYFKGSLSNLLAKNRLVDLQNFLELLGSGNFSNELKHNGIVTKENYEELIVRCMFTSTPHILPFNNNKFISAKKYVKKYLGSGIYRYGLKHMNYSRMKKCHYSYKMILMATAARYKCWFILILMLKLHSLANKYSRNHSDLIWY